VKNAYSAVTVIPSSRGTRNCIFIVIKSDSRHLIDFASWCCRSRNFSPEYWTRIARISGYSSASWNHKI